MRGREGEVDKGAEGTEVVLSNNVIMSQMQSTHTLETTTTIINCS